MFGDQPILSRSALRSSSDRKWTTAANSLMKRFQSAFPEIKYDIAWNIDLFNGTAWREINQRHVRLYGGLLRHKLIGFEACALLFAHETGHHYGGLPRDTDYEWMTCERQADFWAARYGVRMALGNSDSRTTIKLGAEQILAFEKSMVGAGIEWATSENCIPPDPYPLSQQGLLTAGSTSFDRQMGGDHVRYAEIRAEAGEDVLSLSVIVIPPHGEPSIPLQSVQFNVVNGTQPQIVVGIQTADGSPISDGYQCQFTFHSAKRSLDK